MADYVIRVTDLPGLSRLRRRVKSPRAIMEKAGALLVAQGRRAFREQRLGDVVWPERYPRQKDPFINIAPVVRNAGAGQKPRTDDFRRSPALVGHNGELRDRLAYRVTADNAVEAGHPEPWSGMFQWGGVGRIPITERTRETLWTWLFGDSEGAGGRALRGDKKEYASKLAFVWRRDELVQAAYPRPFLGITDQLVEDIREAIARHLGATSGAAA